MNSSFPKDSNPSERNVKTKLCDVNVEAEKKLPPHSDDKSGIGVHYIDAYIKPMNVKLEDGTPVKCKRRGLKITLSAGAKKGEGLMRRLAVSPDGKNVYVANQGSAGLVELSRTLEPPTTTPSFSWRLSRPATSWLL